MAKATTKTRAAPAADVKTARKVIDEVVRLRADARFQASSIDKLNRDMLALSRENRALKEKLKAKAAAKPVARAPRARKAS